MSVFQDSTAIVITDTSIKKKEVPATTQSTTDSAAVKTASAPKIFPKQGQIVKPEVKTASQVYKPKFDKIQDGEPFYLYSNLANQKTQKPPVYTGKSNENNFNGTIAVSPRAELYGTFYYSVIILLVFILIHLAYLRKHYGKYIMQIAGSTFNAQLSNRLYRDRSALMGNVEIQMNFFSILIISLFGVYAFKILDFLSDDINDFLILLACMVILSVYYIFRFISIRLMGFIMYRQNDFEEYQHNTFIYYKVLGLIFLPLTIILIYSPDAFKIYPLLIGGAIICIAFIMRIIRCFVLIVKKGILLFYAILYLCSVEILPLLLVGKFATSFIR